MWNPNVIISFLFALSLEFVNFLPTIRNASNIHKCILEPLAIQKYLASLIEIFQGLTLFENYLKVQKCLLLISKALNQMTNKSDHHQISKISPICVGVLFA